MAANLKSWGDENMDNHHFANVVALLKDNNTVAFIARYRRSDSGNMEVDKIRMIKEYLDHMRIVENRKEFVIKKIEKLSTPHVIQSIRCSQTLEEVEDIYGPYKVGFKGTLANRAKNLGLGIAADEVRNNPWINNLSFFLQPGKPGLSSEKEVLQGVQHIIADEIAKDKETLTLLKSMFEKSDVTLKTKVRDEFKNETKYKEYHDKTILVRNIKAHQVLAINRAEDNKILTVKVECPTNFQQRFFHQQRVLPVRASCFVQNLMQASRQDAYNRLMLPKFMRHKRIELTKKAERESVQVFSRNLRRLLLAPPVTGRVILGMDPGFKHGCKIAVIDATGAILDTDVLHLFGSEKDALRSENRLQGLLIKHNCRTIALGAGKACRETEAWITKLKKMKKIDVVYSIVNEDGASLYSVSEVAQAEMPELDVNLRSAVSIARRLQNPLSELIKIEPRHIGVGMYQHDIPKQLLNLALDGVLEDCVSLVGVDLNASGVHALKRIAGLSERKAKEIIAWRERNGPFRSREQLKEVRGIAQKSFEQCAGFVRVFEQPKPIALSSDGDSCNGDKVCGKRKAEQCGPLGKKRKHEPKLTTYNKLDSTCIHPESYSLAQKLVSMTKADLAQVGEPAMKREIDNLLERKGFRTVCGILESDPENLKLIINGLCHVAHDIRTDFSKPLFREGILSINDVDINSRMTGRITNMTTFGAFVDVGLEYNGLIHISELRGNKGEIGVGDDVTVEIKSVDKRGGKIGLRLISCKPLLGCLH